MPNQPSPATAGLRSLAAFLGVQTAYVDASGVRRFARIEAVEAVVRALTAGAEADPASMLTRLSAERSASLLEPVSVVWLPGPAAVKLAPYPGPYSLSCELAAEDGSVRGWQGEVVGAGDSGRSLRLPELTPGYYDLHVRLEGRPYSSLIIAAPRRAYLSDKSSEWGVFLPLYALHSIRSWGAGDFTDLRALSNWVGRLGGSTVATLPLLAAFLGEEIYEPSPYSPASRLMWNELYVDPERLPEFAASPPARALLASGAFRAEVETLKGSRLVDYRRLARLKRSVLQEMAESLPAGRRQEMERFLEARPEVRTYARFRAATERHGPWSSWPVGNGSSLPAVFDSAGERYHLYAQWVAESQIAALAAPEEGAAGLYLDLPLGVNEAGYDTWRWPDSFVSGVTAGAPPDAFFTRGQSWGFPPLHPRTNREQRYEYVIAFVRHHLRFASRLRIDHVMGLHRLFFIPDGFEAGDGVYVRYPAEELYAILSLESHRHRAEIVGEDLGTVPGYVGKAMGRHGVAGLYVLPFEVDSERRPAVRTPARSEVASLNTHDMPSFAAWWSGADTDERERIGQLSAEMAVTELEQRRRQQAAAVGFLQARGLLAPGVMQPKEVLAALTAFLGSSPARLVLTNLEDLWGETEPQNVPGTSDELPNWRRRARYSLEEIEAMPEVTPSLQSLDAARRMAPRS